MGLGNAGNARDKDKRVGAHVSAIRVLEGQVRSFQTIFYKQGIPAASLHGLTS